MQLKELFTALSKAQAELQHATKDSTNPHFKSKYADLASCLDAIRGPFTKHGLAVTQLIGHDAGVPTLKTILSHSSGEYIESTMIVLTTKNDAQGLGSGVTYARRYALMAICGLGADDDDGQAASATASPKPASINPNILKTPAPKKGLDVNTRYNPKDTDHKLFVMETIKKLGLADWFKVKENMDYIVKELADIAPLLSELEGFVMALVKPRKPANG